MNIQSDAKITITQKCVECGGKGITGVVSSCCRCRHRFTQDEMGRESQTWTPESAQLCGCEWSYRTEYDEFCAECDGSGTQMLVVTLPDLAQALAPMIGERLASDWRLAEIGMEFD